LLLYRHRSDNLNMSSTWLCSRNDLIANVNVLLAAAGSYLLASRLPDIVVGSLIARLFLRSVDLSGNSGFFGQLFAFIKSKACMSDKSVRK